MRPSNERRTSTTPVQTILPATAKATSASSICQSVRVEPTGGEANQRQKRAVSAATRLTSDSAASDKRPTEPVSQYAFAFIPSVISAAAMESRIGNLGCARAMKLILQNLLAK